MRIALAQINPTVGDIGGNSDLIVAQIEAGSRAGVDLVVFPELAIIGYPPADLVLREDLVRENVRALEHIASRCIETAAVVGYVEPDPAGEGTGLFNAAAFCRAGQVAASFRKMLLPNYDIFDEQRYFNPGVTAQVVELLVDGQAIRVGLTICEDIWTNRQFEGRKVYDVDPVASALEAGAELLVNISASPYRAGGQPFRESLFADQCRAHGVPLVSTNQVGGNDELIFDGSSVALDSSGNVMARGKAFGEDLLIVDTDGSAENRIESYPDETASIRQALVLGLRDYASKCGFSEALIGLSGGIDSALTTALAVEALGPDCVHGVALPSRFSSDHSLEDARSLASNLKIDFSVVPIEGVHAAMEQALAPHFDKTTPGVAEENIQARVRGNILMGLANKFGWLLLTTGNKSELAVGYCTLYGDTCGGLAILSDVPKTMVYQLARRFNESQGAPVIPVRTIEKPPSAELRPDQFDQDTLPPYDELDAILEQYVERRRAPAEIVASGADSETVEHVITLVNRNEYKRKQMPVGLKVTSVAFGRGRRIPIAAKHLNVKTSRSRKV